LCLKFAVHDGFKLIVNHVPGKTLLPNVVRYVDNRRLCNVEFLNHDENHIYLISYKDLYMLIIRKW